MKTFNLDGIVIGYETLNDKIKILDRFGITYSPTPEELDEEINRQTIVDAYIAMKARLEQIQNAGVIPFTQAGFNQVVQAVKDDALYIERIMILLKEIYW